MILNGVTSSDGGADGVSALSIASIGEDQANLLWVPVVSTPPMEAPNPQARTIVSQLPE